MSVHEEWEASLLDQAREGLALSDEEQGRHLARLESNLAQGITASVLGDPVFETSTLTKQITQAAALSAPAKGWLWRVHPLSLLGGGLVLGGLAGLFAGHEISPQTQLTPGPAPVPSKQGRNDVTGELTLSPPTSEAIEPSDIVEKQESGSEVDVARAEKSRSAPPGDEPPAPTFYEELSYLRRAQAALRGGDPSLALGIMISLDEMQKVGALDVERRVTKALALCALSRPAEAKAVSAPVFAKQGHSVYAERLKESCVGALPSASQDKQ